MTQEELIENLRALDHFLRGCSYNESGVTRTTVAEAIRRLTPVPPVPGSVEVRVAVAISDALTVGTSPIDHTWTESQACTEASVNAKYHGSHVTHGPVIVAATIHPISVPVVQGKVAEVAGA